MRLPRGNCGLVLPTQSCPAGPSTVVRLANAVACGTGTWVIPNLDALPFPGSTGKHNRATGEGVTIATLIGSGETRPLIALLEDV